MDREADTLPVVVFVLWDDHIYDAWVKKAQELNFTVYNPECPTPIIPCSPSADDNEEKIQPNSITNKDRQESRPGITSQTSNSSVQNETDKVDEDDSANSLLRLPSVPIDTSDTQKI